MASQFDKIWDPQVIGPTYIWHMAYVKNVTCNEIWKPTKFSLSNEIKSFNCSQKRIKKKKEYSIIDKFLRKQIFQLKSKDNKE